MKEKFTKGPWNLLPAEESKEYLRVRGVTLGGRYKIANVLDLQSHHDGSEWCKLEREESIANAKLIACAHEMLNIMTRLVKIKYGNLDKLVCDKIKESEELLKRARGE